MAVVVAALAALAIRVVVEGRAALAFGDAASKECYRTWDARPAHPPPFDPRPCFAAIDAYETAARWYLPLAPHVDDAYARLVELAKSDPKHALAAWRAVRSAALATRSVWTPHADDLAEANAMIVKLSAEHPEGAGAAGQNVAEKTAFYATRYAADPRPQTAMALLAIAGILSWLAGIGIVVRRGIDAGGALVRRPAALGAALTVVGIVAWAVGLYNA